METSPKNTNNAGISSLPRTKEGTLFELSFLALALVVWGIIIVLQNRAPEMVPIHFRADGTADSFATPLKALIPCIITTVVAISMLAGAYFPKSVNIPVRITNTTQVLLVSRLMRILALEILLLTLVIASAMMIPLRHGVAFILCTVAVIIATCILFTILIYRKR